MSLAGHVIQAAQSQLFVIEKGGTDGHSGNIVPYWDWWKAQTGENDQGQSWCACFVSWCFDQYPQTMHLVPAKHHAGFIYCPDLENYGRTHHQLIPPAMAQTGDVVLFDWTGAGIADHTGIVEKNLGKSLQTIEGNTSDQNDHSGSQSNGGGVYRRIRPLDHTIRAVFRPAYPDQAIGVKP